MSIFLLSNEAIASRYPGFAQLSRLSWNAVAEWLRCFGLVGLAVIATLQHGLSLGNTGI